MSGKRGILLSNDEIYHVYNRSIGGIDIFTGNREYSRALSLVDYYRTPQEIKFSKFKTLTSSAKEIYLNRLPTKENKPLVDIYTFALMPDHFHFLVKQKEKNGISIFMSNFQNAYAKYFNKKNDRNGSLMQKPFKAKRIPNEEIFCHVSRYIHLNPVTSSIITFDTLLSYPWTSLRYYINSDPTSFVDIKYILGIFGSINKYKEFLVDQVDYQKQLREIKKLLID